MISFCFINPSWHHLNGGIMSNATFNNISAISWWSVLLVEETRVPGENQRPAASHWQTLSHTVVSDTPRHAQALVSFKKYMPPPLPYFKVNICPVPLPHLALIFFANLWSFRWPNYIVTLPRYFSFRLPHLNIPNWFRKLKKGVLKINVSNLELSIFS
jgi:hypothetical protein